MLEQKGNIMKLSNVVNCEVLGNNKRFSISKDGKILKGTKECLSSRYQALKLLRSLRANDCVSEYKLVTTIIAS